MCCLVLQLVEDSHPQTQCQCSHSIKPALRDQGEGAGKSGLFRKTLSQNKQTKQNPPTKQKPQTKDIHSTKRRPPVKCVDIEQWHFQNSNCQTEETTEGIKMNEDK